MRASVLLAVFLVGSEFSLSTPYQGPTHRRNMLNRMAAVFVAGWQLSTSNAFSIGTTTTTTTTTAKTIGSIKSPFKVAYRSLLLDVPDFEVTVPVALWYPAASEESLSAVSYDHRISVSRIGQLLAGWKFIPPFVRKDFRLEPTLNTVVPGARVPIPSDRPVVLFAHGYLGSRFDMSHIAEELAQQGFICVSPEYPESLAASFPRKEGLDRNRITLELLANLSSKWDIQASSFGIVGHSMGCGTAINTGDESWARVCIAGFTRRYSDGAPVPGDILFVSSTNDGIASSSRDAIPSDIARLDESKLSDTMEYPPRATLVFDRPDAPNHISFLSEGVNDAMIDLLSPLLPVAKAFGIPVLDFDKYQVSRDSKQTARIVNPLVINYLKQQMKQP